MGRIILIILGLYIVYAISQYYWVNNKKNKQIREEKQKRIKGGRCRDCGKPLDEELDNGHVVCLNCRIKLRRPQWVTNGINKKESSYQP